MDCSTPGFPVHHQLPEFTQTHVHCVVMPFSHPILCCPLLLLPSIFPSIRVFPRVISSHLVAKVLQFQVQHHSFQWIFRTDFFGIERMDLLAVQGTLKSLLQHYSSKASIFQGSALFMAQLSHPYRTTGKTIILNTQTAVGKVISLLFNMLYRVVTAFHPRNKGLLISWLQSPSAMILEPKKVKSATVSIVFPSICHEVMGQDAMILVFWMLSFKPNFSPYSFIFIKGSLVVFSFLP